MKKEHRLPGTRVESLSASAVTIALCTCLVAGPGNAQSVEAEESDSQDFDEALDELSIDVANSIDDAVERLGLSLDGDLRIGDILVGDNIDDVRLDAA
jgi:hypothetical protein